MNEQTVTSSTDVLINYGVLGVIAIAAFYGLYWVMTTTQKEKRALMDLLEKESTENKQSIEARNKELISLIEKSNKTYTDVMENTNKAYSENTMAIKELSLVLKQHYKA